MNPGPSAIDQVNTNNGSHGTASGKGALGNNKPTGWRRYTLYLSVGGGLVAVVALTFVSLYFARVIRTPYTGSTWTVKREPLRVTIIERGALESAENGDITCRVKAGLKGSTNASTIKWLIDDGAVVKAGDPVIDLDDSGYQDVLKSQRNTVNSRYADWVTTKTGCTFQEIQNEIDIKTAEVKLVQKTIDLRKYAGELAGAKLLKMKTREEMLKYLQADFENDVRKESADSGGKFTSDYLQQVSIREGSVENARSDKDSWIDRAAWSQRMVKKNLYTLSQADSDQSKLASMEITLRLAEGALDIYRRFDLETQITTFWNAVREGERELRKNQVQAQSNMEQRKAAEASARAIYDQEDDRLRDQLKDEKYYKMASPQDGIVVYYVPEQAKGFSGTVQAIVAQGEPVREGQKLMRIPNLAKMMVNARVHEAMVSKVKGEVLRPTYFTDILRITSSIGRNDLFGLATYQDATDAILARPPTGEKLKDNDFQLLFPGHEARVRVDAYPGKIFKGHVKTVATVASSADFFSSDIKVYQTMISIDDNTLQDNLRPGMNAEVTITADETHQPVLVIPIQSVVGNVSMGANRKVFVLDANGYTAERDIVVGLSSDKLVEVRSGLEEGDKVVLNPRSLLPEKSDMHPANPSTRRGGADVDDKKGKGKGGAAPGQDGKGAPPAFNKK